MSPIIQVAITANTHKAVLLIYEPNIAINAVIIKYPTMIPNNIDKEMLNIIEDILFELTITFKFEIITINEFVRTSSSKLPRIKSIPDIGVKNKSRPYSLDSCIENIII